MIRNDLEVFFRKSVDRTIELIEGQIGLVQSKRFVVKVSTRVTWDPTKA